MTSSPDTSKGAASGTKNAIGTSTQSEDPPPLSMQTPQSYGDGGNIDGTSSATWLDAGNEGGYGAYIDSTEPPSGTTQGGGMMYHHPQAHAHHAMQHYPPYPPYYPPHVFQQHPETGTQSQQSFGLSRIHAADASGARFGQMMPPPSAAFESPQGMHPGVPFHSMQQSFNMPPSSYGVGNIGSRGSYMQHSPLGGNAYVALPNASSPPTMFAVGGGHGRRQGQRRGTARALDAFSRMSMQNSSGAAVGVGPDNVLQRYGSEPSGEDIPEASTPGDRPSHPSSKGTSISSGASFLPPKPDFTPSLGQHESLVNEADPTGSRMHVGSAFSAPANKRPVAYPAPQSAPTIPFSARFTDLPRKPNESELDPTRIVSLYEKREKALLLRIEAIGFEPGAAWRAFRQVEGGEGTKQEEGNEIREQPAPILGIRLLQRLDVLQRENEELGELLSERLERQTVVDTEHSLTLQQEIKDAHELIAKLDEALVQCKARAEAAETNAAALERALAVACAQNSSALTPTDESRRANVPTMTSPSKGKASKQGGGGGGGGGSAWPRV